MWKLHATHGFPIELSIPLIAERGWMIDWMGLMDAAKRDGANVTNRLWDIVGDAYPPEIAEGIRGRLR